MAQGKANTCVICEHPQRIAIDRSITAEDSLRDIATMFATSKDAIRRHKNVCMQRTIPALTAPLPVPVYQTTTDVLTVKQTTTTVLQRVSSLIDVLEKQAAECASDADRRNMNGTAVALLKALELNARLTGELLPGNQTAVQVNVNTPSLTTAPEWGVLMKVLDNHPEIRDELNAALQEAGL